MKYSFSKRFCQFAGVFLACMIGSAPLLSSTEADGIAKPLLQIKVVSQLHHHNGRANYAYLSPHQEYLHFSELLESSLQDLEKEYQIVIKRFPGRFDTASPVFTIYLHDWRSYQNQEVRATFGVIFKTGDKKEDMGMFVGKSMLSIAPVQSLREKSYHEAVSEACDRFAKKLKPQLEEWRKTQLKDQ